MTRQSNHNNRQSAEDLDRLITALQQGKQMAHQHEDGQTAQQLVQIAASIQPRQPFINDLRTQLVTQANQKSQLKKGLALPQLIEEWARSITMKRTILSLAGLTAVIALSIIGWNMFRPSAIGTESSAEVAVVDVETENVETQDVAAPETAVTLDTEAVAEPTEVEETAAEAPEAAVPEQPAAEESIVADAAVESAAASFPAWGRGGGGGGGYGYGEGQGPFTNATLTLNADLPQEAEAAVYATTMQNETTLDQEKV
ncbi:MAG: hypothetical protein KC421_13875, partial [Anaerolineales bacterium]|nr:hypothetical protein [Anaerolineales bacterium]